MAPGINKPAPATIHHAIDAGLMDNVLKVGDRAPDFEVKNPVGQVTSLSMLLKAGPVVLTFYRATLLALSPQVPEKVVPSKFRHGLAFEVLSDLGNEIARKYGLVFEVDEGARVVHHERDIPLLLYNGDESWELPIPSTYVIGQDQTIRYAFSDVDCAKRADPVEVVSQVEALSA
jgi:peroxiredoxin